ncbi:putative sterol uptake control protein [Clavispora lusitaniae]|uniref:Sterol uptake control protein n=1 Tax=Clavispora lusitaniae TaxID=36911 RepID=A0ACD0WIV8_CLALS|nr:putative sterol uptake control protein [Clavispora lusitaniae]QFZ33209.1 putative sterol uptake control protein [Clavispora lusitaniae]QFZ38880.1 putative sterol uptake control protein [Clavispora lusitaniae]QFZ44562.1 putative sterol uptake control protein [Clavispora lusitaniae]QFZ50239.1 putative sterol uptake control protein [Clavispora lusitaniae]
MSMTKAPPKTGKDRKCRRSHKNSRDGCPNCRAKRIKCTEEIPSCSNCVKKELRCGYLDFSPERLEHIRRKNENKRLQDENKRLQDASDSSVEPAPEFAAVSRDQPSYEPSPLKQEHGPFVKQEHGPFVKQEHGPFVKQEHVSPSEKMDDIVQTPGTILPDRRTSVTYRKKDGLSVSRTASYTQMKDMRSIFYSSTFISPAMSTNLPMALPNMELDKPELNFSTESVAVHPTVYIPKSFSPSDSAYPPVGGGFTQSISSTNTPNSFRTSSLVSNDTNPSPVSQGPAKKPAAKPLGRPLAHASMHRTVFKAMPLPQELRNVMLERIVERYRKGTFDLKNITNEAWVLMPRPVWTEEDAHVFWLAIFHQSTFLNIYFLYFMDKAVNILLRASAAVVNGDIEITASPSSRSSHSTPSSPSARSHPSSFFYNPEDLEMLTQKSYSTFDRLIRALRESVSSYHQEYPTKLSLFSAWGCFFHMTSSIDTFCLMMSGTMALIQKSLDECTQSSDLTCALQQEIVMLHHFAVTASYPDYTFQMVESLIASFQVYKRLVNQLINMYETGHNFEPDLVQVLKDPLFRHDFHESDKFLTRLLHHYYPLFRKIDSYYKRSLGRPTGGNMRFLSPSLTHDLANDWFQVYRGDKTCLNRTVNPLKKTLYVFFNALGKCLGHVFPSLKYMSFVDPCNVTFCKAGFAVSEFDPWNRPHYRSIAPVFMDLVKTIKFFECRSKLLGFYANRVVGDKPFIGPVSLVAPKDWEHRDVVESIAEKLSVAETQLTDMNNCVLRADNYPFFDHILKEPVFAQLIEEETARQNSALHHEPWQFNLGSGMSNHDFNASKVIDRYIEWESQASLSHMVPIELLRVRNEHLNQSRNDITNALNGARA